MVAAAAAAYVESLTFEPKLLTGTHAGRNPDRLSSIERRYFERRSQCGFPWRDGNFRFGIVTSDCERRMLLQFQAYKKIAAVQSSTRDTDAAVVAGSGRNPDFYRFLSI